MLKKIAILTVVLAVSSIASGNIITYPNFSFVPVTTDGLLSGSIVQTQGFSVGGLNVEGMASVINLVHGVSEASLNQTLQIINNQTAPENSGPGMTIPSFSGLMGDNPIEIPLMVSPFF